MDSFFISALAASAKSFHNLCTGASHHTSTHSDQHTLLSRSQRTGYNNNRVVVVREVWNSRIISNRNDDIHTLALSLACSIVQWKYVVGRSPRPEHTHNRSSSFSAGLFSNSNFFVIWSKPELCNWRSVSVRRRLQSSCLRVVRAFWESESGMVLGLGKLIGRHRAASENPTVDTCSATTVQGCRLCPSCSVLVAQRVRFAALPADQLL